MGVCYNSTVVNAPIDVVWDQLRNFHDMSWAAGVITSCKAVGDVPGDQAGAKRILNGSFHETLHRMEDNKCAMNYSIDDGPEPISSESLTSYRANIQCRPVTDSGGTFVQWESVFESKDDDLVAAFCNPVYAALLEALKAHFA
ncbi:MAG: SRPBCC family protein [Pirellulaceae bacterium]